jgi:hypothetical protein
MMIDVNAKLSQRTYQIVINCPDDNNMSMVMHNQEVLDLGERKVYNNLGCLANIRYNPENPLHVRLSEVLHAIDTEERNKLEVVNA